MQDSDSSEGEGKGRTQRGVRSLETGGAILRAMAEAGAPLKLRDLAEAVEMLPGQLHPYLVSLRAINLVEQTESGRYALGPFALELGLVRLRGQDALQEAVQRAGALAEDSKLMVALSVWGLHGVTIVHVRESIARIHANVRAGGGFALSYTATGRLFAAHLPPEVVEPALKREINERSSHEKRFDFDEADYARQIAQIKARGYETTLDAPIPGISAVTAPVFDYTGDIKLSVTVLGPTPMVDLDPNGPLVALVTGFTRQLSTDLGYLPKLLA